MKATQALGIALLGMAVAIVSQPLPQKTNVIKIGYLQPFSPPYDTSDELSVLNSFVNSFNAAMCYNALLWYINKTNSDPNILPDTRIEIVPIDSKFDRGVSLTGALKLINQDNVAAIIGESNSRNTVTMAVAAAITNVLHCANLATSPQLANKVDYPTSFRTQSTAVLQAKAMLSLINYFNKTSIGVFSSSDEFGNGLTQQLQLFAPSYNVTIALVTVYDFSKSDLREDLQPFIDGQIQTIILIAAQFPVVNVMRSASQLNMLNGDYWLIGTTGWTEAMYAAASSQPLLRNITGVWQVQTPSFEDAFLLPDGSNAEAVELRKWWTNLFVSNESPVFPGVTKTFSQSYLMPLTAATAGFQFRSNCPNTTETSVANSISKFIFQTTSGNQTINMQAAGNMCTGQGLNYLEGYMSIYALNVGYMILKPTDFMQNTVKCGKLLVGMFDNYIKAGRITPQGINNRQMMSLTRNNITQLVNNANLTDVWGNRMMVDNGGDLQMEQEIWTYRWINITSRRQIVQGASVGKWWRSNNSITLNPNEPLLFLGGKNAPPPNRVIPIVQFAAKTSMRFAFDAIVAICSLFTLCLFVYMLVHQKVKIFMASSPNFLALILIGANISYVGVYLFSIYPMSSQSCIIFGWLKYLGFAVVFGALLVKTYRISVIFVNKKNKVRKMNDAVMLGYFSAFLVCWIAILVVWTVLPSQRPFLELNSVPQVAKNGTIINFFQTPHCQFNDYNYVNLGAMVLTLGGGVWLTYSVRNTPSAFNESKWIAIAIYNWVVIGIVLNAISNFAVKDPDVIFVMEALVVILTQTGVAAALFIPKVMEIMAGRGNNNDTFMNTNSTGTDDQKKSALGGNSSHAYHSNVDNGKLEEAQKLLKNKDATITKLESELEQLKAKLPAN